MTASYFLPKKSGGFPLWRKGNPRRASPDAARMTRSWSRADALEVPVPAGLGDAVPGGGRLDLLDEVLPDPAGDPRAAPVHPGEDHHPVRPGRHRAAEPGAAGQG